MFVSHVTPHGPFIKIMLQPCIENVHLIEKAIHGLENVLPLLPPPPLNLFYPGNLCLTYFVDNKYYRSRINCHADDKHVSVHLLDYGHNEIVPLDKIFFFDMIPDNDIIAYLRKMAPLAEPHILARVYVPQWTPEILFTIRSSLCNELVDIQMEGRLENIPIVGIKHKNKDYSESLTNVRKIGVSITVQQQEGYNTPIATPLVPPPGLLSPKSHNLALRGVTRPIPANTIDTFSKQQIFSHLRLRNRAPPPFRVPPELYSAGPNTIPINNEQASGGSTSENLPPEIKSAMKKLTSNVSQVQRRLDIQRSLPMGHHTPPRIMNPFVQQQPEPTTYRPQTIPTLKSNNIPIGTTHKVYCSYVEDGPNLFSIQLKSSETELDSMMFEMANWPMRNLKTKASIGMACVARYAEDKSLYRAVISNIMPTHCNVAYVDYGNMAQVPFSDIYEIPDKFLSATIFAIRFTLSRYKELSSIMDNSMKEYFKELVSEKELEITVMPSEGTVFVHYCELFVNGQNVVDILKKKIECLQYTGAIQLDESRPVTVRFIESPKKFFISHSGNEREFDEMMDKLMTYCGRNEARIKSPKRGMACAAKYLNEPDWYRVEVISIHGTDVVVEYVDYGFIERVPLSSLKYISPDFVTLPRQSVECCLEGFESTDKDPKTTGAQMEMLVEDSNGTRIEFRLKILGRLSDNVHLINLFDDSITPAMNVASRMYRLCMPVKLYRQFETDAGVVVNPSNKPIVIQLDNDSQMPPTPHKQYIPANEGNRGMRFRDNSTTSSVNNRLKVENLNRGFNENVGMSNGNEPLINNYNSDSKSTTVREVVGNSHQKMDDRRTGNRFGQNDGSSNQQKQSKVVQSREFVSTTSNPTNRREKPIKIRQIHLIPRFNKQQHNVASVNNNSNANTDTWQDDADNTYNQKNPVPSPIEVDDSECWDAEDKDASDSRSAESTFTEPTIEYVSFDTSIPIIDIKYNEVIPCTLSWWEAPHQFYVRPRYHDTEYDSLIKELQSFYRNHAPTSAKPNINSTVIVFNKKLQLYQRARIIDYNQRLDKYKMFVIDSGQKLICTCRDLFEMEKRFIKMSATSIRCSLGRVTYNTDMDAVQKQVDVYMEKSNNKIDCTFIKTAVEDTTTENPDKITFTTVNVDNVNLLDGLVNDGTLTILPEDYKINLLRNQIISIFLCDFKDFAYFQALIFGCDIKFQCSVKNYKSISIQETLTRFKEMYESKIIHVRVNGVAPSAKLIVSPFTPLLGHMDGIPLICPFPIYYDQFTCSVSHIEKSNVFYVQDVGNAELLRHLLSEMQEYYENSTDKPCVKFTPTKLYAGKSSDGQWYRCIIKSVPTTDTVEVRFIDNGKCEDINTLTDVKLLQPQFSEYASALAIKVYLPFKTTGNDAIDKISELVIGYELTANILEYYSDNFIIDITYEGESLITEICRSDVGERIDLGEVHTQIDSGAIMGYDSLWTTVIAGEVEVEEGSVIEIPNITESSNRIAATVQHIDSPDRFYLRLCDDEDLISALQSDIQIVAPSLPQLDDFTEGVHCVAKYSADDCWYRAVIIDSDSEITTIQFMDYGNTDTITDNTMIRAMNDSFEKIRAYAIPCALPIVAKSGHDWDDDARLFMQDLLYSEVQFEYISKSSKRCFVNLYAGERNITQELLNKGIAVPLDTIKSGQNCYISHINSLSDFYIQLEVVSKALQFIDDYLTDTNQFRPVENIDVGTICSANFEGGWYRAKILSHNYDGSGTQVQYIDYGNTSFLTEPPLALPKEFCEMPYLSKRCALAVPDTIRQWSAEAEEQFQNLAAAGVTVFNVDLVAPGRDHVIIDLSIDGESITKELAKLCDKKYNATEADKIIRTIEESRPKDRMAPVGSERTLQSGYIVQCTSPGDFYVHLERNTLALENMCELLCNAADFDKLIEWKEGHLCAAIYPEDDTYYRAKILTTSTTGCDVMFIDYGNTSFTTDLRVLPKMIEKIEHLSSHYALQNPLSNQWSKEAIEQFISIIGDGTDTFQFEEIDSESDPIIVQMTIDGRDVIERICVPDNINDDSFNKTDMWDSLSNTTKSDRELCDAIAGEIIERAVNYDTATDCVNYIINKVSEDRNQSYVASVPYNNRDGDGATSQSDIELCESITESIIETVDNYGIAKKTIDNIINNVADSTNQSDDVPSTTDLTRVSDIVKEIIQRTEQQLTINENEIEKDLGDVTNLILNDNEQLEDLNSNHKNNLLEFDNQSNEQALTNAAINMSKEMWKNLGNISGDESGILASNDINKNISSSTIVE